MRFFDSEQVQENLNDIFHTYQQVAMVTSQLAEMTKEEKLEHIDGCKQLIEKQKNFYFRLSLAGKEDEEAKVMRERIHHLTKAFGFKDLMDCMDAMVVTLEQAAQQELDRP
ncbi:DUF1825 [Synechococcus phage metaG-MbCM1]|uniref:DUF1825 n=1 Tax=Synechococcus phage metaG-MbCM1 TaxID=1079999 RepID=H8ZNL4_9CAUD|nr:DUF1825 [Synechococcus phage metaG-MbCM1]AFD03075.1 DUF1825 [Synechococcus phage metaG-MbCM1]